jgi:gluconolactonase
VTRTELDGTVTVVADRYNGKRLNSPNDLVVASNGSIWFTDPSLGIDRNYLGLKAAHEQEKPNVYRVDPQSGRVRVVADGPVLQPRGRVARQDPSAGNLRESGLRRSTSQPLVYVCEHVRVCMLCGHTGRSDPLS